MNHSVHAPINVDNHNLALLDQIAVIIDNTAAHQIALILHQFQVQSIALLSFHQLVLTFIFHFEKLFNDIIQFHYHSNPKQLMYRYFSILHICIGYLH